MSSAPFRLVFFLICTLLLSLPSVATGQRLEVAGSRALGMGSAFVAVANDSSATWWNPAGLAAGPFIDVAIARNFLGQEDELPADRTGLWSFSMGTPPFGLSYYRYRVTTAGPTAQDRADRQDQRPDPQIASVSVTQFGATVLQTLATGVHVGSTLKYVRGTARVAPLAAADLAQDPAELLDRGDALEGGDARGAFDLDAGIMAIAGGLRLGAVVRNIREPEFDGIRLPRQIRIGAAFDGDAAGLLPLTLAMDADVRTYATAAGDRRVVALGGEHWWAAKRFGLRAGARVNTVGAEDRAVTVGASVAARAGLFLDGHAAYGGDGGDAGWGIAMRASF